MHLRHTAALAGLALAVLASSCASKPNVQVDERRVGRTAIRSEDPTAKPTLARAEGTRTDRLSSDRDDSRIAGDVGVELPERWIVVSTTGRRSGAGTSKSPIDLATALSRTGPARPGTTVALRGGTYTGAFVSTIEGTKGSPIVVRSYPGEWAVLDGGSENDNTLAIHGDDTWFKDLEIMKSDPRRSSRQTGNYATDTSRGTWSGVWVEGARTRLINLSIHDNGDGVGFWRSAVDAEIYGCLIYHNGWRGADHGWGHGVYVQNDRGLKRIVNSFIFSNFGMGISAYDADGPLRGIEIVGVTSFENGSPAGYRDTNVLVGADSAPSDAISLRDSILYHGPNTWGYNARLGYADVSGSHATPSGSVEVIGNRFIGGSHGLVMRDWQQSKVVSNQIIARPDPNENTTLLVEAQVPVQSGLFARPEISRYEWSDNSYWDFNGSPSTSPLAFQLDDAKGSARHDFEGWVRASGLDNDSTYRTVHPLTTEVIMRPNRYERGRTNITVLNWSHASRIQIDVGEAGLQIGERYEIYDVQAIASEPVARGTYDGSSVSLRLDRAKVSQPIGDTPEVITHTPTDFGTFLVRPIRG